MKKVNKILSNIASGMVVILCRQLGANIFDCLFMCIASRILFDYLFYVFG